MKLTTSEGLILESADFPPKSGMVFTLPSVVKYTFKPDRRFKRGYRAVPTKELVKFTVVGELPR